MIFSMISSIISSIFSSAFSLLFLLQTRSNLKKICNLKILPYILSIPQDTINFPFPHQTSQKNRLLSHLLFSPSTHGEAHSNVHLKMALKKKKMLSNSVMTASRGFILFASCPIYPSLVKCLCPGFWHPTLSLFFSSLPWGSLLRMLLPSGFFSLSTLSGDCLLPTSRLQQSHCR